MKKQTLVSLAVTSAFAAVSLAPVAHAADNPFAAAELKGGYQLAQADKKADAKCGGDKKAEATCGGDKAAEAKPAAKKASKKMEGKCGDGKCGAMHPTKKVEATSGTKADTPEAAKK